MPHKNRSNRKANQLRREQAAHRQRPVPLETQLELAAARRAEREAEYAHQGYLRPNYEAKPAYKSARHAADLADVLGFFVLLELLAEKSRRAPRPASDHAKPTAQRSVTRRAHYLNDRSAA